MRARRMRQRRALRERRGLRHDERCIDRRGLDRRRNRARLRARRGPLVRRRATHVGGRRRPMRLGCRLQRRHSTVLLFEHRKCEPLLHQGRVVRVRFVPMRQAVGLRRRHERVLSRGHARRSGLSVRDAHRGRIGVSFHARRRLRSLRGRALLRERVVPRRKKMSGARRDRGRYWRPFHALTRRLLLTAQPSSSSMLHCMSAVTPMAVLHASHNGAFSKRTSSPRVVR